MHSARIVRVLGIELRVDWSVAIVFGLFTWEFAALALPKIAPGSGAAGRWAVAVASTAVFLVTLAAHELSHSLVARRHGLAVRDVTLWMLGGIATIDGAPASPRDELVIAIAGPVVSAAIGLAGLGAAVACAALSVPRILVAGLLWVAMINVVLALFNMVPAAPLDGGRVVRAWAWHRGGDRDAATVTAARAGQVFAWILLAAGAAVVVVRRDVTGGWALLLGWFVLRAARREASAAESDREARERARAGAGVTTAAGADTT